jgi:antitoxin component YwqK of YwqJK toxin-antitoxin module
MIDGQPDGWWKSYNPQGILVSEGNRKNFQLDSIWTFYHDNGEKTLEIHYRQGKKDGVRVQYLDQEFIIDQWQMDTIIGNVNVYYADSLIKKSTPYTDGFPHGMEKEYNRKGLVTAITSFYRGVMTRREFINRTDRFGYKQGNWKFFWANGNLKLEGYYQNDKRNGFFKYYDLNGQFEKVEKFENDRLVLDAPEVKILDKKTTYHNNGIVAISATFYKGTPEGIRREYDTTGKIIKGYVFRNGILIFEGVTDENGLRQGLWKEFYETGELRSEGHYLNSNPTGKWKYYLTDKTVEITGQYDKKGQKTGYWVWYYPDGSPLLEENWEAGKLEGDYVEYDEKGGIIAKGQYVYGEKDGDWSFKHNLITEKGNYYEGNQQGIWKSWYENGNLYSEIEYDQDIPNGKYTTYWENGNMKLTGKYVTGVREGLWHRYNENGDLLVSDFYKNGVEIKWNDYSIK